MRFRSIYIVLFAAVLAAGCGPRSGRTAGPAAPAGLRDFPAVQVPGLYADPQDRQAYIAEHFWDAFFAGAGGMTCDSSTVCGVARDRMEEMYSTFVNLLASQDIQTGRRNMERLFDKVEACQRADSLSNVYAFFDEMAGHYLYDPNSPFRNEDLYGPYAARLAGSPLTGPDMAPARAFEARMCALNATGTPAADFRFTDVAGRRHSLYGIRADYTLLFFSNPGCEACRNIIGTLRNISGLPRMISSGRLAVVNVYIDEDIAAWREYQSEYPREWYNGYDQSYTIRQDLLYHVRAIPSLYMLDADKRVILKDAPEERVFAFLSSISRD